MESSMASHQLKTDLENPSVDYFCIYCRKMLKDSLRIIAKLDRQDNNYINLCPSCLASQKLQIKQYKICGKMNKVIGSLNSLQMDTALRCINTVQQNGIQTMELMREDQDEENQLKQKYLELNKKVFEPQKMGFLQPQPKYNAEQYKTVVKDKNSPNRKHLKALGYNWQRQQFQSQPESVFGILLSNLAREDYEDEEYDKLSSILLRQYMKEQEQISQIKDYLVNSMFLLGKKGFNKEQGMPKLLSDIRSQEEQLKHIIPKICSLVNDTEEQSSTKKEKSKDKQVDQYDQSKKLNERSRTREKQKCSERTQKKKKKQKRRHHLLKKRSKSKRKVSQEDNEIISKPKVAQVSEYTPNDNEDKQEQVPQKRKRGRPKGSVSKEERRLQQATPAKERAQSRSKGQPKS